MEKSGSMTFKEMLTAFAKGPVGLGVLLAWYYCTFYSCVLVWPEWTIRESEQYWAISLAVAALMGVLLYGLFRAGIASFARRQTGRVAAMAAFGMASVSSLLIFAGYMLPSSPTYLVVVGAVLSGIALPMLLLIWIEVLRQLNEEIDRVFRPRGLFGVDRPLSAHRGDEERGVYCRGGTAAACLLVVGRCADVPNGPTEGREPEWPPIGRVFARAGRSSSFVGPK